MGEESMNQKESGDLTTAHMILEHAGERAENSDLYRWAQLVVKRHETGQSIARADEWLSAIMAGMDVEHMEGETTPGTPAGPPANAGPEESVRARLKAILKRDDAEEMVRTMADETENAEIRMELAIHLMALLYDKSKPIAAPQTRRRPRQKKGK